MANKNRYTAQQIVDALKATKGMIYYAADRLGCHPDTIRNYGKRYASVRDEMDKQDGMVNDLAELKLIQAINAGDLGAIKYRLSTKAKDRGYVERSEVQHSGSINVSQLSDDELRAILED